MKEIQYKAFSLRAHKKNWGLKRPNVCQFELTFGCGLHCRHCYTDCYNTTNYLKKELCTKEIKIILDKVHREGVLWLCLTGGDPLAREDFLEIYLYAKKKGFIITLFSNGYSMTKEMARSLKKNPPFSIEMTLNAITGDLYEKISQVKGSFIKTMEGIRFTMKAGLPLKIKTQVTVNNFKELPSIKKFLKDWGLRFLPTNLLHARLNGDISPCNLRVPAKELARLKSKKVISEDDNPLSLCSLDSRPNVDLFSCTIGGGDGIYIDPYGNTFPCALIRNPAYNLLKVDVGYAQNKLLPLVRGKRFVTNSRCKVCKIRELCIWCPGRALVETGDMEAPIGHYCQLAHSNVMAAEV